MSLQAAAAVAAARSTETTRDAASFGQRADHALRQRPQSRLEPERRVEPLILANLSCWRTSQDCGNQRHTGAQTTRELIGHAPVGAEVCAIDRGDARALTEGAEPFILANLSSWRTSQDTDSSECTGVPTVRGSNAHALAGSGPCATAGSGAHAPPPAAEPLIIANLSS